MNQEAQVFRLGYITWDDQASVYRLPALERFVVRYATETTVRLQHADGSHETRQQHLVYCLPDETAWQSVQAAATALQDTLDGLAVGLRGLGRYAAALEAAGGVHAHPAPLTPTVIACADPDGAARHAMSWGWTHHAPHVAREPVVRHTAQKLEYRAGYGLMSQTNHFVCASDADWDQISTLHHAVKAAQTHWETVLAQLGLYHEARADGRYARAAAPGARTVTDPVDQVATPPVCAEDPPRTRVADSAEAARAAAFDQVLKLADDRFPLLRVQAPKAARLLDGEGYASVAAFLRFVTAW